MNLRSVLREQMSKPTTEGAGVRLRRAFGHAEAGDLDPFLMLDHFRSSDPQDYQAGFPFHPHRGIETVTYMISGEVEHEDSLGHRGVIGPGDVQWMTAGSGILHQEMPRRTKGELHGFQLWVNLPRASKMMPPRYRELRAGDIPLIPIEQGVEVKLISGALEGRQGPVVDLMVRVRLMDVRLGPETDLTLQLPPRDHAFAYVYEGSAHFEEGSKHAVEANHVAILGGGDEIWAKAGQRGCRFLLAHGEAIGEPIAWGGPIVMNTRQELDQAFEEIRRGTFIKSV
jgi:redox-sensitive bicupin YhaK (pirin superfamily)